MNQKPPTVFTRLVKIMFSKLDMEEIEGDLEEDFSMNVKRFGFRMARFKYCLNTLFLVRTYLKRRRKLKKRQPMKTNLSFYFKYGLRSIFRHKFYHSLNVASLTLGFCCFTLIFLFVISHAQKDSFLKNKDQIVRLSTISTEKEGTSITNAMPPVLKENFPEIESFTRMGHSQVEVWKTGDDNIFSIARIQAEPAFLDIFQVELISGRNITSESQEVLISEYMALKLWNSIEEALGQEINIKLYGREAKKTVVGITKNTPVNASFSTDLISSMNHGKTKPTLNSMVRTSYPAYFKVKNGTNLDSLAAKIPVLLKKYTESKSLLNAKYIFRTLDDIKYNQKISTSFINSVDGEALLIFKIVGLVVLTLAFANYVNISTAITLKRIKETGIRRIMGATSKSILWQQVSEAIIIGLTSISLSVIVLILTLKWTQDFIGYQLVFTNEAKNLLVILGICFPLAIVIIGSIYPALLLSGFKFKDFIRGKWVNSPESKGVRTLLLVVQFSIATFLIVGTFTFLKQLDFINELHNKEKLRQVLVLNGKLGTQSDIIMGKLKSIPEVSRLSLSSIIPGPESKSKVRMGTADFKETFDIFIIDEHFLDIMRYKISDGINFYLDDRNKSNHILINQSMAATTVEGSPLNKEYKTFGKIKTKVIGIIADFPISSIKEQVKPAAYFQKSQNPSMSKNLNKVILELNTSDIKSSIAKIEKEWQTIFPEQAFDIQFMDDKIERIYTDELKMGKLFGVLTTIAIIIACMGIFGLLTYMVEIKTKEIGIRKVLGANFTTLARLLTRQIWMVLFISGFIAFPISYYFLEQWLTSFAYRTTITWDLYAITLISFIVIIGVTVFSQVRYASSLNPSDVLRNE